MKHYLPLLLVGALAITACDEPPNPCQPGTIASGGRCLIAEEAGAEVEPGERPERALVDASAEAISADATLETSDAASGAELDTGAKPPTDAEPAPDDATGRLADSSAPSSMDSALADAVVPTADGPAPELDAAQPAADGAEPDAPEAPDGATSDAGDAAAELCGQRDFERWRDFVASDDALATMSVCTRQNPGCLHGVGPCNFDRCLLGMLGMSGCEACVSAQTTCVAEACLNACHESSTSAKCRACACAYGCIDAFNTCAGRLLACAPPSARSDLLFYSRQERVARAYASDARGALDLVGVTRELPAFDQVVHADFNGDGLSDVLLADFAAHVLRLYTSDGFGHLSLFQEWSALEPEISFVIAGHFDADAFADVLLVDRARGTVHIYASDGAGRSTRVATHETGSAWSLVLPGHFNADGITDMVFANLVEGRGTVYLSDGHGGLIWASDQGAWWWQWTTVLPGNFDDDAQTELLFFASNVVDDQLSSTGYSVAGIYDVPVAGQFVQRMLYTDTSWVARPHQQLMPLQLDGFGYDELLLYSPQDSALQFYKLEADLRRSALSTSVFPERFWQRVDAIAPTPQP